MICEDIDYLKNLGVQFCFRILFRFVFRFRVLVTLLGQQYDDMRHELRTFHNTRMNDLGPFLICWYVNFPILDCWHERTCVSPQPIYAHAPWKLFPGSSVTIHRPPCDPMKPTFLTYVSECALFCGIFLFVFVRVIDPKWTPAEIVTFLYRSNLHKSKNIYNPQIRNW